MPNRQKPCDVETLQDFAKYYGQGMNRQVFGIYDEKHKTTVPAHYISGGETRPMTIVPMRKQEDKTFALQWDETHPMSVSWEECKKLADFGIPKVGMVQVGSEIAYGSMAGDRNSARGLDLNRIAWTDFNHWYLRKNYGPTVPTHHFFMEILWQVYTREYPSVGTAWNDVMMGKAIGVAVHPNFGLYTLPDCAAPILAYKKWSVGHLPSPHYVILHPKFVDYTTYVNNSLFGRAL